MPGRTEVQTGFRQTETQKGIKMTSTKDIIKAKTSGMELTDVEINRAMEEVEVAFKN